MTTTITPPQSTAPDLHLQSKVLRTIAKKSFCTLATTSPATRSHVAGVVYEAVDGTLWIHSLTSGRKVRSIQTNPHVGVCIPFRKLPVGPPYTIHFQATARIVGMADPEVQTLQCAGKLKSIAGHGALEMPDGCFIAVTPHGTVHSFGPGARTIDLIRDPINSGARSFRLDEVAR